MPPPPPVPVEIVAPVEAPPGAPVDVAVVVKVPAGWHIYWENPGQSGLATDVGLTGATGPRWPVPTKFVSDGIESYGYTGDTAFLFQVTPSAAGTLPLSADARWLLCKDVCVRGEAKASGKLVVREGAKATPSPFRARLPRPFAESGGTARIVGDRLEVRLPGGPWTWFPTVALEATWSPASVAGGLDATLTSVPADARLVLARGETGYILDLSTLAQEKPR